MPTMLADAVAALASLGGLGGIGAVVTAAVTARKNRGDVKAIRAEVSPNHGSSLLDAVRRIESSLDDLRREHTALDRRLGHEIGEIKADMRAVGDDQSKRLARLEDHVLR